MREVPRGREAGAWYPTNRDGRFIIVFICPNCQGRGEISGSAESQHEIAADGTVTPSIVCDCGFHESIKLLDWA